MNYKFALYILITLYLTIGCRQRNVLYNLLPSKTEKKISYRDIKLDSLVLKPLSSSLWGKICVHDNFIDFIDQRLCWIFRYDQNGIFVGRFIGQGNGANQLPISTIEFFAPTQGGGYLFIGRSWDCFVFDRNFKETDDYQINWNSSISQTSHTPLPDTNMLDGYSLAYGIAKIHIVGDKVLLPLFSRHPLFNPTTEAYASSAKVLAIMDITDGYIEGSFGRLSPFFIIHKNARVFSYALITPYAQNRLAIIYPPDSLIYIASEQADFIQSFGFAGRDMDTSYHPAKDFRSYPETWLSESRSKGYYSSLEYIPGRKVLFRSYQKGSRQPMDGLQIYKGDTLIADVDVPKGFCVEGYIAPFFYSNGFIDETTGNITIYKFRLDTISIEGKNPI